MRWFTSDLHLGHKNIIHFCDRPFSRALITQNELEYIHDVQYMNTDIIDTLNMNVGPDDELWILGDYAMGNTDLTIPLAQRLTAGRIVLVPGNHDRCHPMYESKSDRYRQQYEKYMEVADVITDMELKNGVVVQISHFPYATDPFDFRDKIDRFSQWRPTDNGGWLLCGHVHEKWQQIDRMINVGLDAWAGLPVPEDKIIDLIEAGPQRREVQRWT